MRIYEAMERPQELIDNLLDVWEASVRATHLFLSDAKIAGIRKYVPAALSGVAHLIIAEEEGYPVAFMGAANGFLEMLFIAPEERGRGLGRQLILKGINEYSVRRLSVNEQNPDATRFYERMGFRVFKRNERDSEGNPYPILEMRRMGAMGSE